jgi:hypothetical protein
MDSYSTQMFTISFHHYFHAQIIQDMASGRSLRWTSEIL